MNRIIDNYFNNLRNTINKINYDEILNLVSTLDNARKNKQNIFIMGNGGSGTNASHIVCDFNKGVIEGEDKFKFICLNDNIPTILAYANDLSYDNIFVEQLKNLLNPNDVVIGISGSGNSANVLKAIHYANENNAITVGITGYDGGELKQIAQNNINSDIDDMQISEDIHIIIFHLIMQIFNNKDFKTEITNENTEFISKNKEIELFGI